MLLSVKNATRLAAVSATSVLASFVAHGAAIAGVVLNGAGATFPAPLYQRYFSEYKKSTGVTVNYNAVGSGAGIRQFAAGTVDFGASDVVPTAQQKAQMKKGLLMVPTAGGAVAVVYNLGTENLKISRANLSRIFSGELKTWNQLDSKLPNKPIKVVVRADASGTTDIFTSHLSAISPTFKKKVGASSEPNWGFTVLKGPKNDGVAALVKQTYGAIGYVQDTYARQNASMGLKTAWIQNKAGRYVDPSLAEANKAISGVAFNADFSAEINDPKDGYPIVGMTWLLVKQNSGDPKKAEATKKLLRWILTSGQKINPQLEYTQVPSSVAQRAVAAVNKIK